MLEGDVAPLNIMSFASTESSQAAKDFLLVVSASVGNVGAIQQLLTYNAQADCWIQFNKEVKEGIRLFYQSKTKATVDLYGLENQNSLIIAIKKRFLPAVQLLKDPAFNKQNFGPNYSFPRRGLITMAFCEAVKVSDSAICEELMEAKIFSSTSYIYVLGYGEGNLNRDTTRMLMPCRGDLKEASPLGVAVRNCPPGCDSHSPAYQIVSLFLSRGASIGVNAREIHDGKHESMEVLPRTKAQCKEPVSLLNIAASKHSLALVSLLVEYEANIDYSTSKSTYPPIVSAVQSNDIDSFRYMLDLSIRAANSVKEIVLDEILAQEAVNYEMAHDLFENLSSQEDYSLHRYLVRQYANDTRRFTSCVRSLSPRDVRFIRSLSNSSMNADVRSFLETVKGVALSQDQLRNDHDIDEIFFTVQVMRDQETYFTRLPLDLYPLILMFLTQGGALLLYKQKFDGIVRLTKEIYGTSSLNPQRKHIINCWNQILQAKSLKSIASSMQNLSKVLSSLMFGSLNGYLVSKQRELGLILAEKFPEDFFGFSSGVDLEALLTFKLELILRLTQELEGLPSLWRGLADVEQISKAIALGRHEIHKAATPNRVCEAVTKLYKGLAKLPALSLEGCCSEDFLDYLYDQCSAANRLSTDPTMISSISTSSSPLSSNPVTLMPSAASATASAAAAAATTTTSTSLSTSTSSSPLSSGSRLN